MRYLIVTCAAICLCGCITINKPIEIEPFPIAPILESYAIPPIVSFMGSNQTYVVTTEFVGNAAKVKLYLEAIHKWKIKNNIR